MKVVVVSEGRRRAEAVGSALSAEGHHVVHLVPPPGYFGSVRSARRLKPDAVHAIGLAPLTRARIVAGMSGARLVYDAESTQPRTRLSRIVERLALRPSSLAVAPSAERARDLRSRARLALMPVVVADDHGAILGLYHRIPGISAELRSVSQPRGRRRPGGLLSAAFPPLRRVLRSFPGPRYLRARLLRSSGRFEAAAEALEAIHRSRPDDPYVLRDLARTYMDLRRDDDARAVCRKLLAALDPQDDLTVVAAIMLARLGARFEAITLLERLESLEDPGPRQLVWAATVRAALDDLEGARDLALQVGRSGDPVVESSRLGVLELVGEPSQTFQGARELGDSQLARRLEGMVTALSPTWRPCVAGPRVSRPAADNRVLHVLEASLPHAASGYAYRSRTVLDGQRRAGLVPVASTRIGFPMNRGVRDFSPIELVDGIVHHRYALRGVTRYSGFPHDELVERHAALLSVLVDELRPAFLQAATPYHNGIVARSLARSRGLPFVYDVRGFGEMTWAAKNGGSASELYRLRRAAETALMGEADLVVTLSRAMKEVIVSRGVDPARVQVIPHVVDTHRLCPRPRSAKLVESYGFEEESAVVGCVSSLTHYEGIDLLVHALADAMADLPGLRGLIVGEGPSRPALQALATELGVGDRVLFTGRVPHQDAVDHLSLLDLFVVPRRNLEVCRSVTPLKPFEALAAGCCLVTSDVPALAEATGWGEWGATFRAEDRGDLAGTIIELTSDSGRREQLARAGRTAAVTRHGMPAMVTGIEAMLGSIGLRPEPGSVTAIA